MNHTYSPYEAMSPAAVAGDIPPARTGSPVDPETAPTVLQDAVIDLIRMVYDPEIPVNLYDLGLIYDLEIAETGDVTIAMSLTAPNCPVAGSMPQAVADAVARVAGVGVVTVSLVWDPPWTPARMSEDAKIALDMY